MQFLMANRITKKHIGLLHDVLMKVEFFIILVDFVIMDCEVDFDVPFIL